MLKTLIDYGLDDSLEEQRIVRDTSREAYHELMSHPLEVNGRYRQYLEALEEIGHPSTDQEVTKFMGKKDPNYFRPRRRELSYDGNDPKKKAFETPLIKNCGKRKCKVTGKTVHIWWFTKIGYETVKQWRVNS